MKPNQRNVYLIGSHMTKTDNYIDKSYADLVEMTLSGVLADAKLDRASIETIHFGNCGWGWFEAQECIRGQIIFRGLGIGGIPIANHEGACATGSLALHSAIKDIWAGVSECSLAVGVEKLNHKDKRRAFELFFAGMPNYTTDARNANIAKWLHIRDLCKDVQIPEYDERGRTVFMDWYATIGLAHMQRFGTTLEDIAAISAKNHMNSVHNPLAQYRFPMTVEEVINDYMVSYPLTRSMCAPMSDGAASAIVCSEDFLRTLPQEVQSRAVLVRATVYMSGFNQDIDQLTDDIVLFGTSVHASKKAYELAGIGPEDIDVAEVHDATSIGELGQYENLGFCERGEGGAFARSGATKIGGKLPINPSGGLISRGHPIAATGLCMVYEIMAQLRGEAGPRQVENAKIGLIENGGGVIDYDEAACAVTILEKVK